ncbi:ABC transporter permease [Haloprofundus halobius]|uniref:ABC transporter permease n=1 Tax=Haloprofundus halobius TaxID=2876194 RepID=UPI001CCD2D4D|nr:ABC transporter permease [Haloprofundus halobius]
MIAAGSFLGELVSFAVENAGRLARLSYEHVVITLWTLLIALPIAISLGVLISYYERAATVVLWVAGVLMTIPAIAFFGVLVPVLGIGNPPTIAALVAYTQLPVIRNTYIGLTRADDAAIEAGTGLGMTRFERLRRVRLPVALPVMMAGVRNAVIILVGLAAIGAFIGAGGLGDFIFYGISAGDTAMIVVTTVVLSVLALAFDYVFGVIEEGLRLRNGEEVDRALLTRLLATVHAKLT